MGDKKEKDLQRRKIMDEILNEHYSKSEETNIKRECISLEEVKDEKHSFEEALFTDPNPKKGSMVNKQNRHKQSLHEGNIFPCGSCDYQARTQGGLSRHKQSVHEGRKFFISSKYIGNLHTSSQYMKEGCFPVVHVTIKQVVEGICLHTSNLYMMEGNFPVARVTIR